ncbi:FkbM family methyltransferase [Sorangium sp. So ce131]|uniref:FkbM family methyltransferase n=1 Tax=Sorangium sp. So ce131 TaxID=3133282 RepID=UPI003F638891
MTPTLPIARPGFQGPSRQPSPWHVALLSAGDGADLDAAVDALRARQPEPHAEVMVRVLHMAPGAARHRAALLFQDAVGEAAGLGPVDKRTSTGVAEPGDRPLVFMFPGLGDHYINMGRDLYRCEPTFREQVDLCAELLKPEIGLDIRSVIYPGPEASGGASAPADEPQGATKQGIDLRKMLGRGREAPSGADVLLNQTRLTQPALFVVEYALAKVWQKWAPRVDAMIGYSLGEYVAACIAGVLSLEDALTLTARRAQMIEDLPPGGMLAVSLPEAQVRQLLGDHLSLSAVNGPEFCVVSGPREEVLALEKRLAEQGTASRRVQSSHAFHSRMMDPIAERLTRLVETYALKPPQIPYASNVTGELITAEQATDPAYWAAHLSSPVRFADGIGKLLQRPERLFLEVGPGQTLSSLVLLRPEGEPPSERVIVPSMRHAYDVQPDGAVLLKALSRLWLAGAALDDRHFQPIHLQVERSAPAPSPVTAATEAMTPAAKPADAFEPPRTKVERDLAALWQKLLPAQPIGRGDDFFERGGNSLIATRLVLRVQKSFRVNLPLRRVYERRTLASMAELIEAMQAGKDVAAGAAERAAATGAPRRAELQYRLPNGIEINHQNEGETRHFYEDIFEHRSYVKHGIRIPKDAIVFDVGANIGLFTLFTHTEAPDARIYSFEPAPPLFAILSRNVERNRVRAELFNIGLSNDVREASFTFYPNSSGMSSFHADEAEEKHNLRAIIENQRRIGVAGVDQVAAHQDELLDVRFEAQTFTAKLRRLSDIIRERGVPRIDLLKVDVQKCELEVLEGIDAGDFPKIAQIVLEVHDIEGRVDRVKALLERRGFAVVSEQDALYVGTNIHNVYAVRRGQ